MKRSISIFVAIVLVMSFMSFAGCSKTTKKQEGESSTAPSVTDATGTLVSGEEDDWIDEIVTKPGTFPIVNEKVSYNVMVRKHVAVEDFMTNDLTLWYEEKTNVHMDMETVPGDGWDTKLNLMFASNEYPDMIIGGITREAAVLYGSQGYFIPLNDLIKKYCPNVTQTFEEFPFIEKGVTTSDGTIYAFPGGEENYQTNLPMRMWYYKPWMEKLNAEVPTTTEEYYQYLKLIKETDLNENGKNDEIPLVGMNGGWFGEVYPFLMNAFIFCDKLTFLIPLDDGTIIMAAEQEEWKEGLHYLNKLYEEGLIYDASFSLNQLELRSLCENPDPIVGTVPFGWWGGFVIHGGPSGRFQEYDAIPPLEGPNGLKTTPHYDPHVEVDALITDKAANPEVLARWVDWFFTYEGIMTGFFGFEGEGWKKAEPGQIGIFGEPALHEVLLPFGPLQNKAWHHRLPSYITKTVRDNEAVDQSIGFLNDTYVLANIAKTKYDPVSKYAISRNIFMNPDNTMEIGEIGKTLKDLIKSYTARFITGNLDIDKDWDTYIKELNMAGKERYIEIYQEEFKFWWK